MVFKNTNILPFCPLTVPTLLNINKILYIHLNLKQSLPSTGHTTFKLLHPAISYTSVVFWSQMLQLSVFDANSMKSIGWKSSRTCNIHNQKELEDQEWQAYAFYKFSVVSMVNCQLNNTVCPLLTILVTALDYRNQWYLNSSFVKGF